MKSTSKPRKAKSAQAPELVGETSSVFVPTMSVVPDAIWKSVVRLVTGPGPVSVPAPTWTVPFSVKVPGYGPTATPVVKKEI